MSYYSSGPRVKAWAPWERYYRWGTDQLPKPGELEYLGLSHWVRTSYDRLVEMPPALRMGPI